MVAFLDSLRPPGSPRSNRLDLSFHSPNSANETGALDSDWSEEQLAEADRVVDMEAERIKDRSAYEKFLKINVKHITDGQGIVAGVLLVTPNTVMFDPNVSDPLVIEHGAEAYGVIAPIEFVANASLYSDIARIRQPEPKMNVDNAAACEPIYMPTNCPLHRKYAILKKWSSDKATSSESTLADDDQSTEILAVSMDEGELISNCFFFSFFFFVHFLLNQQSHYHRDSITDQCQSVADAKIHAESDETPSPLVNPVGVVTDIDLLQSMNTLINENVDITTSDQSTNCQQSGILEKDKGVFFFSL